MTPDSQLTELRRQLALAPPPPPGFVGALVMTEAMKKIMEVGGDAVDVPLMHNFFPGLYQRTVRMNKGTLVVSKIHLTEHPFVIHSGDLSVWTEADGWVRMTAPFSGVTKPWTVRVLFIHEDTVWSTFHATSETDVDKIESQIILNPQELCRMLQQQ